jgi:hypothetical protein
MNIGGGGGVGVALSVGVPVAGAAEGLGDRGSVGGSGGGMGSDICAEEQRQGYKHILRGVEFSKSSACCRPSSVT